MFYVLLALYFGFGICIYILYNRKITTHLELLSSQDLTLKKFSSVHALTRSSSFEHQLLAFKIMLPIYFTLTSATLNPEQLKLVSKLKREVIALNVVVAVLILLVLFF